MTSGIMPPSLNWQQAMNTSLSNTISKRSLTSQRVVLTMQEPTRRSLAGQFAQWQMATAMRYYGVRDQMLYTEGRLQKIRLLRLKLEQFRKQVNKPYNGYEWENELAQSTRYDTGAFETLLADVCDLIPAETGLLNKLLEL